MSIEQTQNHEIKSLSKRRREELRRHWNGVMVDPFAFTPHEERERGLTVEKAEEENRKLGMFAADFLKQVITYLGRKNTRQERLARSAKVVDVGSGKNHASHWLDAAVEAGLGTLSIDVSDIACGIAESDLRVQWDNISSPKESHQAPIVRQGEIQTILAEPESIELDTESVEIWYFCRLLGCLSEASARAVLQEVGWVSLSEGADPEGKRAVVIVNAFKDDNQNITSKTSILRSKESVLRHLSVGAGREVKVVHHISHEETYKYFAKTVSAMTIMANTQL